MKLGEALACIAVLVVAALLLWGLWGLGWAPTPLTQHRALVERVEALEGG